MKITEQTINILHDLNKEYRKKCKTTFTKTAKEIFRGCFRIMGAGSLHEIIIYFVTNRKILKINTPPIILFTHASLNLIKKAFGSFCVIS